MRFVQHLICKRKDLNVGDYSEVWSPQDIKLNLMACSGTVCNYAELLLCEGGDSRLASPGKLYLDRDAYFSSTKPTLGEAEEETRHVLENVTEMMERLKTGDNDLSCVIATRHGFCPKTGRWKQSYRPFIQGLTIRYTDIPKVIMAFGQQDFWDMSVYKASEQLLATINCCKGQLSGVYDGRILVPQCGTDSQDPLLYTVQYVEVGWRLLDLPEDLFPELNSNMAIACAPVSVNTVGSTCPIYVNALTACLNGKSSDDRVIWIKIAHILKWLGEGTDLFLENWLQFSRKGAKYTGDQDCRKTWSKIQPTGACKIGSLIFYASQDNQGAYKSASCEHMRRCEALKSASVYACATDDSPSQSSLTRDSVQIVWDSIKTELGLTRVDESSMLPTWDPVGEVLRLTVSAARNELDMQPRTLCIEFHPKDLRLSVDGVDAGYLNRNIGIPVSYNLSPLNNTFNGPMAWNAVRPSQGQVRFHTDTPGTEISANNFNLPLQQRNALVTVPGLIKVKRSLKDMQLLQDAYDGAVRSDVLGRLGLGNLFVVQNGNNNNLTIQLPDQSSTDFAAIRSRLLNHAHGLGLRKLNGLVYKPVEACPCAYVQQCDYKRYINTVLAGNPQYTSNPKRFDECVKYLTNYTDTEMPDIEIDRDVLSFSNGVLQLVSGVFTLYADLTMGCDLTKRVARHHIPHPYTDCEHTPLLDKILDPQFGKDVAQVLCALIGRSLFTVGQLDGWQIMLFMSGVGGTGKSLVLNIIANMFAPEAVGNLAAKREEVFGMANLVDKEVVLGSDMPAKMSASLPQEIMQTMTAGDRMEIPRKGLTALQVLWTAPVIVAGNHFPDYVNTGNNVGRRMVTVRFDNIISNPEDGLLKRIIETELPNIVARCLKAYRVMINQAEAAGGFWKCVPHVMIDWKNRLSASTNKLSQFLEMDDDERGCSIGCIEGKVTWLIDFKAVFEAKMGRGTYIADPAVFSGFGFRVSDKREKVCKSCKQPSRLGCCPDYCTGNRVDKNLIHGMDLNIFNPV